MTFRQGKDEGFRVEVAVQDEDAETWEDAMDEMEDVWMREPTGQKVTTAEIMLSQQIPFCLMFGMSPL